LKRQAKTDVDQAGQSFDLMKQVSLLENQVSDLMAKTSPRGMQFFPYWNY
jgi:hypothetical protein